MLDACLENATATRARLGAIDQKRMDEFLDSVRAVELKVTQVSAGMGGVGAVGCSAATKPTNGHRHRGRHQADHGHLQQG